MLQRLIDEVVVGVGYLIVLVQARVAGLVSRRLSLRSPAELSGTALASSPSTADRKEHGASLAHLHPHYPDSSTVLARLEAGPALWTAGPSDGGRASPSILRPPQIGSPSRHRLQGRRRT